MIIISSAFSDGQPIPLQYGCRGENISPPLEFKQIPAEAKSLVLIVDDPDALVGDWVHWLMWNIPPTVDSLKPNTVPLGAEQGFNDFGNNNYGGPCPHSGTHRYQFKIYALDAPLTLAPDIKKADLLKVMENHVLDQAILTGTYSH